MNINKPQKHSKQYYDYNECRDFLQQKYNYNERDYSKHFGHEGRFIKETGIERPPYYSVRSDKGGYYAYPINKTDKWKYYISTDEKNSEKEVTEEEWKAAREKFNNWKSKFEYWQLKNPQPEYQDFWHWVVDFYDIHNGCNITFDESAPPPFDWQKEIFMRYIEEFSEGEKGKRTIDFSVSW